MTQEDRSKKRNSSAFSCPVRSAVSHPPGNEAWLSLAVADTWMQLSYVSQGGERNRALTIIKSRGMAHSNQVRELILSDRGMDLADVYAAGGSVIMGTLRWEKENQERHARAEEQRRAEENERRAELAFAETKARLEALSGELGLRRAALDDIRRSRKRDAVARRTERRELLERRGADLARGERPRA